MSLVINSTHGGSIFGGRRRVHHRRLIHKRRGSGPLSGLLGMLGLGRRRHHRRRAGVLTGGKRRRHRRAGILTGGKRRRHRRAGMSAAGRRRHHRRAGMSAAGRRRIHRKRGGFSLSGILNVARKIAPTIRQGIHAAHKYVHENPQNFGRFADPLKRGLHVASMLGHASQRLGIGRRHRRHMIHRRGRGVARMHPQGMFAHILNQRGQLAGRGYRRIKRVHRRRRHGGGANSWVSRCRDHAKSHGCSLRSAMMALKKH